MRFVNPSAGVVWTNENSAAHGLRVIEEHCPDGVAAGFEAGEEVLLVAAILFSNVLHDGRDAFHIEIERARVLNPVPYSVGVVIGRHAAITAAAVRDDQRRDDDKWAMLTCPGESRRGLHEFAVGAFNHYDDRPLSFRG